MSFLAALAIASLPLQEAPLDEFDVRAFYDRWTARVVWIQREITEKLLTPSAELSRRRSQFLAQPDTGLTRLMRRTNDATSPGAAVLIPGGGTYYSFHARAHGYSLRTDIYLSGQHHLRSGTFVGDAGLVIPLGVLPDPVKLAGFDEFSSVDAADKAPEGLADEWKDSWRLAWEPAGNGELEAEVAAQRNSSTAATLGHSYLVRARMPKAHDVLVAVTVDEVDEYGVMIAWRILKRFPTKVEDERSPVRLHAEIPAAPAEFADDLHPLSLPSLFKMMVAERNEAKAELLSVPNKLRAEFERAVGPRSSFVQKNGAMRLMRRDDDGVLLAEEEGACYFSFALGTYGWAKSVQLALDGEGRLRGGYGEQWLLDLGGLDHAQLRAALNDECPVEDERKAKAWAFMHNVRAVREGGSKPAIDDGDLEQAHALGISTGSIPAAQGHGYLLRTIESETHDQTIFFTILEDDGLGLSIAWEIMESYPMSSPPPPADK